MFRAITLLFVALAALHAESDQVALRALWASPAYVSTPIPGAWLSSSAPAAVRDLELFRRFMPSPFTISAYVAQFGSPDRYLVSRRADQSDYLIYDLPSGVSVALYVTKPPHDSLSGIAIIDPSGRLIALIK